MSESAFDLMTFLGEEEARQKAEPFGLAIIPNDETETRQYRIVHWREDGLCDYSEAGSYPTEERAHEVRAAIIARMTAGARFDQAIA